MRMQLREKAENKRMGCICVKYIKWMQTLKLVDMEVTQPPGAVHRRSIRHTHYEMRTKE